MANLSYYIGVDHREPDALKVTEQSAIAYMKTPVPIGYLEHQDLRKRLLFDRPWRICEDGNMLDERDGKPFSVQFSHTRFLTPIVAKKDGHTGWALFTDCDWLFLDDINKLLLEVDEDKTVMVVPHEFVPRGTTKMDNKPQSAYPRKLWSAFMLWNLSSPKLPTIEMVNHADGGYLHGFRWLKDGDIGFLSEKWHWVPNYSPMTAEGKRLEAENKPISPCGIHFTYGPPAPGMTHREPTPFDQFWRNELIGAYNRAR